MAVILCIETTTTNCSVAISKSGLLLGLKEYDSSGYSHAEKLHVFINELLTECGLTIDQLDAIAVSKGPGSYTGLRIGVSTAKGLAFSLAIPLISVATLQSLAKKVKAEKNSAIIAMLDARRMEAYTAVFDEDNQQLLNTEATILEKDSFEELFTAKENIYCVGNAVQKFAGLLGENSTISFTEANPSAREMVSLAFNKYKISDTEDVAYFEPYYLKDFIVTKKKV
ncbi:tRNA (adenosine(37)-N6)-threonylcarbamoyltransferase complex dimerization subunit type 1 TsaB [Mesonia aquimarina]|uniref:tRNA (adenosine(37)-N6)-threonylcarbamoyltransferase complex dimerization subunit type 1 TsaB n=1 Tax=Mesonia aquimarina TaxID=1504967 RepID=UPI000EF5796B|nr:tRNA (adenosine(37)-N6)-threonylcarbamoyltransferase complex dimerization subunit type 1 TsaB [Mesonia aquimarina]